jgi:hypothetical protein
MKICRIELLSHFPNCQQSTKSPSKKGVQVSQNMKYDSIGVYERGGGVKKTLKNLHSKEN